MVNSYMNHRKIYEQHFGPIPKDASGRSLEVHHIDGDHSNNDLSNLKLVTIDEHYAIHYSQEDWAACLIMSYRMRIPPEIKSELSKKCQQRLVTAGIHHWQGPAHNQKLIEQGIHPFLDKDAARERNIKRINDGNHNFIGETNPVHDLIKSGTHHFQTNNPSTQKISNGTHHFLNAHPNKIQVQCPHCQKIGGAVNMKRYHFDKCKKLSLQK
jgi:hypothetical protein